MTKKRKWWQRNRKQEEGELTDKQKKAKREAEKKDYRLMAFTRQGKLIAWTKVHAHPDEVRELANRFRASRRGKRYSFAEVGSPMDSIGGPPNKKNPRP